ncbi:hypothetical protein D3C83_183110 [compost metagenome]
MRYLIPDKFQIQQPIASRAQPVALIITTGVQRAHFKVEIIFFAIEKQLELRHDESFRQIAILF